MFDTKCGASKHSYICLRRSFLSCMVNFLKDGSRLIGSGILLYLLKAWHMKLLLNMLLWCFCILGAFLCLVGYLCVFFPPSALNMLSIGVGSILWVMLKPSLHRLSCNIWSIDSIFIEFIRAFSLAFKSLHLEISDMQSACTFLSSSRCAFLSILPKLRFHS